MSLRKHGLKALGLSFLAALGLMAYMASAASAAPEEWYVKEKVGETFKLLSFLEHGITLETATGQLEAGQLPKLNIAGIGLTIGCDELEVLEGSLRSDADELKYLGVKLAHAHVKLLYKKCVALDTKTGKELAACNPIRSSEETKNGFITAKILVLIVLHEKDTYLLAEGLPTTQKSPEALPPFTTVVFPNGECAAEGEIPITGSTVIKIGSEGKGLQDEKCLLLNPITEAETKALFPTDQLKFGARNAYLASSAATALLTGALKEKEWNALAE